jgi:phenylpropionate dioxygenase-like ring-hydroxylating dioxygenase large terminal subunit
LYETQEERTARVDSPIGHAKPRCAMLAEDNAMLTQVGPGTVMGDLLPLYWNPAVLSSDLAGSDAPPMRIRLLGEDLVTFRDTSGAVGVLAEHCPHRRASLYFGRVEDGGLRCIYHGWKFARDGRCLEMPNELSECGVAGEVRTTAYPCRERNGVVWIYLGPRADAPPLPDLEWNLRPDVPPFVWRAVRFCNWLQALEGDIDSAHLNILHATLHDADAPTVPDATMPGVWSEGTRLLRRTGPPLIDAIDTACGALYSARRAVDAEHEYHRVHPFLLPFHTMVGGAVGDGPTSFNGKAWVPIDDERTLVLEWQMRPDKAWSQEERAALERARHPHGFLPATGAAWSGLHPRAHRRNDYLRDRALETTRQACGILSNPLQDAAVQESMGTIVDRTKEHLGPSDAMIVRVRRCLIEAARALRARGEVPPGVDEPRAYRVRPVGALLPRDADWRAATQAQREAFGGV